jgi:hypothetical protein
LSADLKTPPPLELTKMLIPVITMEETLLKGFGTVYRNFQFLPVSDVMKISPVSVPANRLFAPTANEITEVSLFPELSVKFLFKIFQCCPSSEEENTPLGVPEKTVFPITANDVMDSFVILLPRAVQLLPLREDIYNPLFVPAKIRVS